VPKMTWTLGSAIAIICIFCALTYTNSGAVTAALETTLLAVSLYTVLKVSGRGNWATAFRSLLAQPGLLATILILLALFIARRWEGLNWKDAVEIVLVGFFYWAGCVLISLFFERHVFARPSSGRRKSDKP